MERFLQINNYNWQRKIRKYLENKRVLWENYDIKIIDRVSIVKENTIVQPKYLRSKNRNNDPHFDKQVINKIVKSNTGLHPKVSQIKNINHPIINNLFPSENTSLKGKSYKSGQINKNIVNKVLLKGKFRKLIL